MKTNKLIIVFALVSRLFVAETIKPVQAGNVWGVEVQDLPVPQEELIKSVKSGLTTISVMEASLVGNSVTVQTEQAILKQYYDLWEENYYYQIEGRRMVEKKSFKTMDALLQFEKTIRLESLGMINQINENLVYRIKFRYLLNPIDKSKTEKIRSWIAENRVSALGSNKTNAAGIRFNALFDSILNEYFVEGGPSAKWEMVLESAPFQFKGGKLAK